MIAIVDYGVGNLFSLRSSLEYIGAACQVTGDRRQLEQADKIILPGVGAFGDAAGKLRDLGLDDVVRDLAAGGKPLLGICLGMQLLFQCSYEHGRHPGLGLLPGEICPLSGELDNIYKVPHMGWNSLRFHRPSPLLGQVREGDFVYYVHSFYAKGCGDAIVATSLYGVEVPGLVQRDNVYGAQFHPEKSGTVGLGILRAFSGL